MSMSNTTKRVKEIRRLAINDCCQAIIGQTVRITYSNDSVHEPNY
jgi:hypothetical protein